MGEERSVRGSVFDNSADDTYFGLDDNLPVNDVVACLQICREFDSTLDAALMFKGKMLVEEIPHAY